VTKFCSEKTKKKVFTDDPNTVFFEDFDPPPPKKKNKIQKKNVLKYSFKTPQKCPLPHTQEHQLFLGNLFLLKKQNKCDSPSVHFFLFQFL
jgi:hypothetical protein